MIRQAKSFNLDHPCKKGGGTVTVSGTLFAKQQQQEEREHAPSRARITHCTGIGKCGATLPRIASGEECEGVSSLLAGAETAHPSQSIE